MFKPKEITYVEKRSESSPYFPLHFPYKKSVEFLRGFEVCPAETFKWTEFNVIGKDHYIEKLKVKNTDLESVFILQQILAITYGGARVCRIYLELLNVNKSSFKTGMLLVYIFRRRKILKCFMYNVSKTERIYLYLTRTSIFYVEVEPNNRFIAENMLMMYNLPHCLDKPLIQTLKSRSKNK